LTCANARRDGVAWSNRQRSAPGLPDWTASGKAVFNVEYKKLNCPQANSWNFGSILKTLDLFDTPWTPCR
jgi:hypothetical protein